MTSIPWWVPILVGIVGFFGSGLGAAGAIWSQRLAADRTDDREKTTADRVDQRDREAAERASDREREANERATGREEAADRRASEREEAADRRADQREEAADERLARRETVTRQSEAARGMLAAAYICDDGAHVLQMVLSGQLPLEQLGTCHRRYLDRWQPLVDNFAGVVLTCPDPVVREATHLNWALRNLADFTDAWYLAVSEAQTTARFRRGDKWENLRMAAVEARQDFIQSARRELPFIEELDRRTLTGEEVDTG